MLGHLPGFAVATRIAWSRVGPGYNHHVGSRGRLNGIVQLTLSGCGEYQLPGQLPVAIPVGVALCFHSELHADLRYRYPPGPREPWEFCYLDLDGAAARGCLGDLVAARGHALALDQHLAAVHACLPALIATPGAHRSQRSARGCRTTGAWHSRGPGDRDHPRIRRRTSSHNGGYALAP